MNHKTVPIFTIVLLFALLLSGCGETPVTASGFALDTLVSVTAYGVEEDAVRGALDECADYEALFSATVETSDVCRLNRGEVFSVSPDTAALLEKSLYWAEYTGGAFDPALGNVTGLWDFSGDTAVIPEKSALAAALAASGWEHVTLDGDSCTPDGVQLDLGGVAKGYIADCLGKMLSGSGAVGALVDLGGDVLCLGHKPDGSGFTVGVRDPFGEAGSMVCAVTLTDKAIVTSGTYERYFEVDGVRYHHILDPETGAPARSGLASVTVIADSAADGDALATACMVLGAEKGMALIEGLSDTWAIFITDSGEMLFSNGLSDTFPVTYPN